MSIVIMQTLRSTPRPTFGQRAVPLRAPALQLRRGVSVRVAAPIEPATVGTGSQNERGFYVKEVSAARRAGGRVPKWPM